MPANGMKQYPENPQISLSVHQNELLSQAVYRIVYIPQKSGEIVLPEISLKWFNVQKNMVEIASIAEHKIKIAANPEYDEIIEKVEQTEPQKATNNILPKASEKTEKSLSSDKNLLHENSYLWLVLAFILGMIFNYLLFSAKKSADKDAKLINKIRKNLKANDYRRLRDNLLKFGNENFADFGVNNLNDLALLIGDEDFALQMQLINRILYVDAKETPDAQIILNCLKNRTQRKEVKKEKTPPLPKLYD